MGINTCNVEYAELRNDNQTNVKNDWHMTATNGYIYI